MSFAFAGSASGVAGVVVGTGPPPFIMYTMPWVCLSPGIFWVLSPRVRGWMLRTLSLIGWKKFKSGDAVYVVPLPVGSQVHFDPAPNPQLSAPGGFPATAPHG